MRIFWKVRPPLFSPSRSLSVPFFFSFADSTLSPSLDPVHPRDANQFPLHAPGPDPKHARVRSRLRSNARAAGRVHGAVEEGGTCGSSCRWRMGVEMRRVRLRARVRCGVTILMTLKLWFLSVRERKRESRGRGTNENASERYRFSCGVSRP